MKNRRGLGKGLGMGYKNLVPLDAHIHSLSAKGMKTRRELYLDKYGNCYSMREYAGIGLGKGVKIFKKKKDAISYAKKHKIKLGETFVRGNKVFFRHLSAKMSSPELAEVMEMKNDLAQEFFKTNYKQLNDAQKEEVDDAYREMTFRLSAKEVRELQRKGFNIVLAYKIKGVPVKANVKIDQLNPEDVIGVPDIVMKDRNGSLLRWVSIDNATGNIIGEGVKEGTPSYKRVLMNEKDQIIPHSEVEYYQKVEGKLKKVQQFESNIGGNKQVQIEKVLPKEDEENYLIESTYQLVGQKEEDDNELYAIAKELYDDGKIGVISVVFRQGFKKQFGLVVPTLFKDRFSVIVRMTRAKVSPFELDVPSGKAVKKAKLPTIKVKEPF